MLSCRASSRVLVSDRTACPTIEEIDHGKTLGAAAARLGEIASASSLFHFGRERRMVGHILGGGLGASPTRKWRRAFGDRAARLRNGRRQRASERAEIVIFAGLSLRHDEIRDLPNVDARSPVRSGDLDALTAGLEVAIIDGVLDGDALISMGEIRGALARGVRVSGAASVGAWRAAELARFGMRGHGWVHQAYRSGRIAGTDEIALLYDPVCMRPLTVPLVNVRYGLERLVSNARVKHESARAAFIAIRDLAPASRDAVSVGNVLRRYLGTTEATAIVGSSTRPGLDIKAADARALVRRLKRQSWRLSTGQGA